MIDGLLEEDYVRKNGFKLFTNKDMNDKYAGILASSEDLFSKDMQYHKICMVNKNFPVSYQRLALQILYISYIKRMDKENEEFYKICDINELVNYLQENDIMYSVNTELKLDVMIIEQNEPRVIVLKK